MTEINRRQLMAAALALPGLGALASCTEK